MDAKVKQSLLLGAIAGFGVGIGFSLYTNVWWCMLLCPFTALMGAAPHFLKPADMDD